MSVIYTKIWGSLYKQEEEGKKIKKDNSCYPKFSVSNKPNDLYLLGTTYNLHIFHTTTWQLAEQFQITWTLGNGWGKAFLSSLPER